MIEDIKNNPLRTITEYSAKLGRIVPEGIKNFIIPDTTSQVSPTIYGVPFGGLHRKRIEATIYAEAAHAGAKNLEETIRGVASSINNRTKAHPEENLYDVTSNPMAYLAFANQGKNVPTAKGGTIFQDNPEYKNYLNDKVDSNKASMVKKIVNELYGGSFKDTIGGAVTYHAKNNAPAFIGPSDEKFPYKDKAKNPANILLK